MNIRTLLTAAAVAAMLTGGTALAQDSPGTASTPVSDAGVTPYIIDGDNPGGNRTCEEVGEAFYGDPDYYSCSSGRINYNGSFQGDFDDVTGNEGCDAQEISVQVVGPFVSWTAEDPLGAGIVKGSDDANVYNYDPLRSSDSGLASPPNASGKFSGLSNLTFCWNPDEGGEECPPCEAGEWCSPGFWSQPQHLAEWEATGYSPTDLYSDPDIFGEAPPVADTRPCGDASVDPTLLEVLQSPQCYGGDAFNNVGTLLSIAHPCINYTGTISVEGESCPLPNPECPGDEQ
jgi:hypothetical protein